MTPAALETYRLLRALELPPALLRRVGIEVDGKPNFRRLSDPEFDDLLRAFRCVYPDFEERELAGPPAFPFTVG